MTAPRESAPLLRDASIFASGRCVLIFADSSFPTRRLERGLAKSGVEVGGRDGVKGFWDVRVRVWKRILKIGVTDYRPIRKGKRKETGSQRRRGAKLRKGKRLEGGGSVYRGSVTVVVPSGDVCEPACRGVNDGGPEDLDRIAARCATWFTESITYA